ncbi:unnamed protein product [Gongylonema pulchrum]|uniref:2-oxoglutarate oxidoreductase n=1 Tax=Gongylonema pulchrum TaxID=637853 RepID=A0A183F1G2_9BILA|nr:unnamed protein product [Gongylonema pulchrum]
MIINVGHPHDEKLMEYFRSEKFEFGIIEQINFGGYAIFSKIGLKNYATAMAVNLIEVAADLYGVSSNPSYVPG